MARKFTPVDKGTGERGGVLDTEDPFDRMFEGAAVGMALIDLDGLNKRSNKALRRMLGYDAAELEGLSFVDLTHPEDVERVVPLGWDVLNGKREAVELEFRLLPKHGDPIWVHTTSTLVRRGDGAPRHVVVICQDVSKLTRLEQEIAEVTEHERRRLGHDLHDGLGQQLVGLALLAGGIQLRLRGEDHWASIELDELMEIVEEAVGQTRFLMRGLAPIPIVKGGLDEGFDDLATRASKLFRVDVVASIEPDVEISDPVAVAHLYHVAREAVTNAVRHGQANRIVVRLESTIGGTRLSIRDDGAGIHDPEDRGVGIGLRSMRFRAAELGGDLDVRRGTAGGTQVTLTIPSPAGVNSD